MGARQNWFQSLYAKQIELLDVSIDELQQCLDQIEIDLGFIELVKITAQYKIPLTIVSDGLDFVIRHILKNIIWNICL